jgi:pyruvate/2-oxoglutarate/acetoin dehydrogenase E1 component
MALYHAGKSDVIEEAPVGAVAGTQVVRNGGDVTLTGSALMLKRALRASETLAGEGISTEVIDMRAIYPSTWRPSMIWPPSWRNIPSMISKRRSRGCPPPPDIPLPFARELEAAYLPEGARICDAVRKLTK